MHKVLLPVDGSASAFQATLYIIDFIKIHGPIEVHVVNVQPKIPESLIHGVEKEPTNEQMAMDAHLAMKPVFHALNEEGIAFQAHIKHGDVGETLVTLADELACDHIVMGTRGLGAIMEIMLGSVTKKVLHLANIPVICIKSDTHYR
jgi:nucleotide-binding universal stress UspA family protein